MFARAEEVGRVRCLVERNRDRYPNTPYLSTVVYEWPIAKQNLNQTEDALKLFGEVATKYRDEVAARVALHDGLTLFLAKQI